MEPEFDRKSAVQEQLGLSDEEFDTLVQHRVVEVLRPPASDEEIVPKYALQVLLREGVQALLRQYAREEREERQELEYTWAPEIAASLDRHFEIQRLLEQFLQYIKANTSSHHFTPMKRSLRIRADGDYASLTPRARGLQLWVTREGKQETKFLKTEADFADGLNWIQTRSVPWPMKGSLQKMREKSGE